MSDQFLERSLTEIRKLRDEARVRATLDVWGEQARRERAFARGEDFAYSRLLGDLPFLAIVLAEENGHL